MRKIRVAAAATTMSLLAAMGTLGTALGAVDTLLSGATIEVASMSGTSKSAAAAAQPAPAAPTATGQLPWTGGNGVQMAAVGAFLLALGLGFRHWLSMILRCD